jgi:hypothetical protein
MTRTGFVVLSIGVLLCLPLLYGASALAIGSGMPDAGLALIPVVIVSAGVAVGVLVMLRARAAQLSGLWGFLAMILTVQGLALLAAILIDGHAAANPVAGALGSPALWLLVSFILFLLWVPNWAGPRALDIGMSAVAALAAMIVIAVGHTMHGALERATMVERVIADIVAAVPSADWIGFGVFVTALAGIMVGRMLPEAE